MTNHLVRNYCNPCTERRKRAETALIYCTKILAESKMKFPWQDSWTRKAETGQTVSPRGSKTEERTTVLYIVIHYAQTLTETWYLRRAPGMTQSLPANLFIRPFRSGLLASKSVGNKSEKLNHENNFKRQYESVRVL